MALGSKLVHTPGTWYHYSNRGANLVSGIVAKASGMRTDRYVDKVLFKPLGITHWWWEKDHAGQPQGLAGLHLEPRDLAKIGELVRLEGEYDGKRVVSAKWIQRATEEPAKVQPTSRRLGLLWWLVPAWTRITITKDVLDGWQKAGVDAAFIDRARPLVGKTFTSTHAFLDALRNAYDDPKLEEFRKTIWKQELPDAHFDLGPTVGSYSEGTLGQFVVILPHAGLVAVRMRREPKRAADRNDPRLDFVDFVERVQGLLH
jgi:CubicO group peptidase (beta-lactamase class C family)